MIKEFWFMSNVRKIITRSSRSWELEWSVLPFPDPQSPLLGRVTQKEAHSPGSRSAYPGMCRKEPSSLLEPQSVSARSASLEQEFLRSNKGCHMFLPKTSIEWISKHDPGDFPTNTIQSPPTYTSRSNPRRSSGRWRAWRVFTLLMTGAAIIITAFLRGEFGTWQSQHNEH